MDYTSNAFKVIGGFFFLIGVFLIVVGTMGGRMAVYDLDHGFFRSFIFQYELLIPSV
ncbi:hypothetical protein ACJA3J_01715 [Halobacillus sp. SY10]|uniref:hypothetical protein n=1 Tax=Halobacillus sp. SY10 TaxID=3381356 RepID=UPI003879CCE2